MEDHRHGSLGITDEQMRRLPLGCLDGLERVGHVRIHACVPTSSSRSSVGEHVLGVLRRSS
ncbi:hypothetical protein ACFFX0_04710 [Citricoccus parietis]|uniref:Uncharacterized protein n=1 Tax=Citricoccus parietis TaxID=592307 RepID=A0ABV5FV39_9MICC